MLLLELEHISFEAWLLKVLQGLPEDTLFSIMGLRREYLMLCWKEEELWKRWCDDQPIIA